MNAPLPKIESIFPAPSPRALEEVLAYRNPSVLRRFRREHPEAADSAERLFDDLLRFFWISRRHAADRLAAPADPALDFVLIMDEEMRMIDQMWHVFLLYTQDYADFCARYFGEFLHHLPDVVPALEGAAFDPAENLTRFLSYLYDRLGADTVERWFAGTLAIAHAREAEARDELRIPDA